jgi:hypothetical protein
LTTPSISLAGKPPVVQGIVVAAIVVPLFMLAAFWAALLRPGLRGRWVWLLMVAIGFGALRANMSTGEWGFQLLSVQLFGAGANWSGSAFDAWIVTASLPLGALAFWFTYLLPPNQDA